MLNLVLLLDTLSLDTQLVLVSTTFMVRATSDPDTRLVSSTLVDTPSRPLTDCTRGRLRLNLRLRLMLRLILTTDTDTPVWDTMDMGWDTMVMVWDTTAMVLDTMVMDTDMDTDSDTTDKMEAFNCACAIAIRTSE